MTNVVPLAIPPKQDTLRHRRIEYTLTYQPEFKAWAWEFSVVERTRYAGKRDSYEDAKLAAKLHIDLINGVHSHE